MMHHISLMMLRNAVQTLVKGSLFIVKDKGFDCGFWILYSTKLWQIWQITSNSPKYFLPIFTAFIIELCMASRLPMVKHMIYTMVCLIYSYTLSPRALGVYIRQITYVHGVTIKCP